MTHQVFPVGLGLATRLPDMDFETFSEAGFVWVPETNKWTCLPGAPGGRKGLEIVGLPVYATHESTEVVSFYYDLKEGRGRRHWRPGMPNPVDLFEHLARGGLIEAFAVGFEWWIWTYVCRRLYGWPELPLHLLRCAQAKARAHALPGKLAEVANVLDLPIKKDTEGTRLIKKFTMPRNPSKLDPRTRMTIYEEPVDGQKFISYNETDIIAEEGASIRIPDLSPFELEVWKVDQIVNRRGVQIDLEGMHNCVAIVEQAIDHYTAELRVVTGGRVQTANELKELKAWLEERNVFATSMDEEAIDALLAADLPPDARRAVEIRSAIGSASVKKVFSMRNQVSPLGRLHELFGYHAARTGRWNGNGPQPQNLTKDGPPVVRCGWDGMTQVDPRGCGHHYARARLTCPWCGKMKGPLEAVADWSAAAAVDALTIIAAQSFQLVELFFGDVLAAVSGVLRALFIAAPGHRLVCSDYSAIEGVVIAALAGEEWRLEVFRTHGKIYEMSASKITGVPLQEMLDYKQRTGKHHPHRNALGKFAELGSGFGGWIPAWKNFGADKHLDDNQIKDAILKWRRASPMIEEFWGGQWRGRPWDLDRHQEYYGLEGAAISAVMRPGEVCSYRGIRYVVHENVLYCLLLSDRLITYHRPRLERSDRRPDDLSLSFEGWNTNPKMGPIGWVTMWTYGGKLTENVVQATARDILAYALVNCERRGYRVVLHVHDEIVCEMPDGQGSVEELEKIMSTLPPWAKDWPVKAKGGWEGPRYGK